MILKRIGLVLAVVGIFAFGAGSIANAQTSDYPPKAPTVVVSDTTPPANGAITVTVNSCNPGETVTVTLPPGAPVTAVCGADGTIVFSLSAPVQSGPHSGTVVVESSGTTLPFQVNVAAVPAGGLPATGSNGTLGTVSLALGALVLGAGLLFVAQLRRRRTVLA